MMKRGIMILCILLCGAGVTIAQIDRHLVSIEQDSMHLDYVFQDTSLSAQIAGEATELKKSIVTNVIAAKYEALYTNLQQLAFIHLRMADYEQALEYLSMAGDYCALYGNKPDQAVITRRLGTVYTEMGMLEKGMEYLKEAHRMFIDTGDTVNYEYAKSLKNVGLNYSRQDKYRQGLQYFKRALVLGDELDMPLEVASSYANMAGAYLYLDSPDSVLLLLDKAEEIFTEHEDMLGLGTVFNNRGEYYLQRDDYRNALNMFVKANYSYGEVQENRFRINALKNIALMHYKLGNKDEAVKMYQEYISANAKMMRAKLDKTIQNMDARYRFVEQRRRAENQLALSKKQAKLKSYQVLLLAGLLIILVAGTSVYIYQRKLESKLVKVQLEKEKSEKTDLRNEIGFKDRELEGFALNITHKNKMLEDIKEKLNALKEKRDGVDSKKLRDLKYMIDQFLQNDKELEDFHKQVEILQQNFLYVLKEEYPYLNENETRLCVLLRLGISSKDIALMRNVSEKSVHMARYRLRKKMGLDSNTNLVEYLKNI
ncbi:MAG: tetratricopeptide repeat protein [Bacteroidales bacterium]